MKSSSRGLLIASLALLWLAPSAVGVAEEVKPSPRRASPGTQSRTQTSTRSQPATRSSSTRSSGTSTRSTGQGTGTWVGPGKKVTHPPSHRPPHYRPPGHRPPYYRPPYYPGWGYGYWGYPFYWGGYWGPYWGAGWGGYWGGTRTVIYRGAEAGALDLDISPEEAQVAVDGSLVGTCDDFDGYPDYLWLKEGQYTIDVFLEGYETQTLEIQILAGVVQKMDFSLEEGESVPPSLEPRHRAPRDLRAQSQEGQYIGPTEGEEEYVGSSEGQRTAARIWLKISPGDASVYLDGRFLGTADEMLRLHTGMVVSAGQHLVEVVRPGYESGQQSLVIEPGDELEIQLELTPE